MLNLAELTKDAIDLVSPYLPIKLKIYNGQQNDFGLIISNYIYFDTVANIQSTNKKELKDVNGIAVSDSLLTFYIINKELTTVDRVLNKGSDFIIFNNITYKIIKIQENFNTGWISVIASEYKNGE